MMRKENQLFLVFSFPFCFSKIGNCELCFAVSIASFLVFFWYMSQIVMPSSGNKSEENINILISEEKYIKRQAEYFRSRLQLRGKSKFNSIVIKSS